VPAECNVIQDYQEHHRLPKKGPTGFSKKAIKGKHIEGSPRNPRKCNTPQDSARYPRKIIDFEVKPIHTYNKPDVNRTPITTCFNYMCYSFTIGKMLFNSCNSIMSRACRDLCLHSFHVRHPMSSTQSFHNKTCAS